MLVHKSYFISYGIICYIRALITERLLNWLFLYRWTFLRGKILNPYVSNFNMFFHWHPQNSNFSIYLKLYIYNGLYYPYVAPILVPTCLSYGCLKSFVNFHFRLYYFLWKVVSVDSTHYKKVMRVFPPSLSIN